MTDHQDAYYHNQKNIKTMRYLLQERFIGACLGGVIAERLCEQTKTSLNKLENNQLFWLEIHQEVISQIPLDFSQSLSWKDLSIKSGKKITISELALVILPLILYYHDNLPQLELVLYRSAQHWQIPDSHLDGILWWSIAVALILREKLNPEDLLHQLTATSKILRHSLPQDLVSLQKIFDRGLTIIEATAKLSLSTHPHTLPFILSLYCFYQTPEDFRLTIKQAMKVKYVNANLLALTGFLSGVYNSKIGLPSTWEKFCQNRDNYPKIWQLGARILALWSGVYDPGNDVNITAIIATPRTLQNRSHLKIISQKEYESK
ncbi:MAG: hypothetical protein AB4372_33640 [Xenococcus sp. (in: cyanobacteria)]